MTVNRYRLLNGVRVTTQAKIILVVYHHCKSVSLLGRHGSASLCRVERKNKMAATYNVLAFKR